MYWPAEVTFNHLYRQIPSPYIMCCAHIALMQDTHREWVTSSRYIMCCAHIALMQDTHREWVTSCLNSH
jgi:hypothetical protein